MIHFPVTFHLGSFDLNAHMVFEYLAYFLGYRYYRYLRKKQGDILHDDHRMIVIIGGIFGAVLGSKVLGLLDNPPLFLSGRSLWETMMLSKTIVGGLLGGLIGVEITKKMMNIRQATGDLMCYPLIFGMAIGRIGCFCEGVQDGTWGKATIFFLAMNGGDGLLRHPLPLYEISVLLFSWCLIKHYQKRYTLQEGTLFKIFMVCYLSWRLLAEFLKDGYDILGIGLTSIQLACVVGLVYYYQVIFYFRRFKKTPS